jgi:ATP-binding cassette subfamily G (WHITE) protein 2 (SNQ2)
MLVLGRPEAGCSTLREYQRNCELMVVRSLTNDRTTFMDVSGHIQWGNVTGSQAEELAGELVFNNEEEIHAATLSVFQSLDSNLVSSRRNSILMS